MLRSYDKTTHKRRGIGTVDENEAGTETSNVQGLDGTLKDRALSNSVDKNKKPNTNDLHANTNRSDLFGRKKNSNQVLKEKQRLITLTEKGKPSTSNIKRSNLKSVTPLKRPASSGSSPIAKRPEVGQPSRQLQLEHGYPSEQESPYVPDDISPFDLDLFDGVANISAYETANACEMDASPLYEIESFPTKRRQFNQSARTLTSMDDGFQMDIKSSSPANDTIEDGRVFVVPTNNNTEHDSGLAVPTEIEYCPSPEQELAFQPELDPIDLTLFSPSVNLSAYDLSKYFDYQVEFSDDLFDDEDVSGVIIDLVDDYGIYFDDVAVLFKTQDTPSFNEREYNDIDYSEIPFSNHTFDDIPLVV